MTFKKYILATAVISLPMVAQAQNVSGPYLGLGLGATS